MHVPIQPLLSCTSFIYNNARFTTPFQSLESILPFPMTMMHSGSISFLCMLRLFRKNSFHGIFQINLAFEINDESISVLILFQNSTVKTGSAIGFSCHFIIHSNMANVRRRVRFDWGYF